MKKIKLGIVFGGMSTENEVSVKNMKSIKFILQKMVNGKTLKETRRKIKK